MAERPLMSRRLENRNLVCYNEGAEQLRWAWVRGSRGQKKNAEKQSTEVESMGKVTASQRSVRLRNCETPCDLV